MRRSRLSGPARVPPAWEDLLDGLRPDDLPVGEASPLDVVGIEAALCAGLPDREQRGWRAVRAAQAHGESLDVAARRLNTTREHVRQMQNRVLRSLSPDLRTASWAAEVYAWAEVPRAVTVPPAARIRGDRTAGRLALGARPLRSRRRPPRPRPARRVDPQAAGGLRAGAGASPARARARRGPAPGRPRARRRPGQIEGSSAARGRASPGRAHLFGRGREGEADRASLQATVPHGQPVPHFCMRLEGQLPPASLPASR